jgi:predicted AAA+ superfamily ATPase
MAISNRDRVSKALDLLRDGLGSFVEREVHRAIKEGLQPMRVRAFEDDPSLMERPIHTYDAAALLKILTSNWNDIFRDVLGFAERNLASELRDVRNNWAHQNPFSSDDTDRALDSAERLLLAVSSTEEAESVRKIKMELRRVVFDEQARNEKRKGTGTLPHLESNISLKPWREVVVPHQDVRGGSYQQAEFAADLWQVHVGGDVSPEYGDPREFYRRTFLTQSLIRLIGNAIKRLAGRGGDPVVQLQTNFGGGKTHSMLALYHLVSGSLAGDLPGVEALLKESGAESLPRAKRVVLVGNRLSPGNPRVMEDGTSLHTLWGELAWQLGGREAYEVIRADDEKGTSPGDRLKELLERFGPCLILIDEWVAYARQLHEDSDLPGGSFETHFTFAQALTESAKVAKNCLLVISLPASDNANASPHSQADDVEVGGKRGREALDRLRNVIGRLDSSWTPATAEEGFEIVRRRLFEPIADEALYKHRDLTARSFADFYRENPQDFPPDCRQPAYEKRIKEAYPIHPEVFDRLYQDWSTLLKFQRTRGVLRLMATVIHDLWERGDTSPLILPGNLPIDAPPVSAELTRYLTDSWIPILGKEVDGPESMPVRIDTEIPALGRFHMCRRVARTIYLGTAPGTARENMGLEDRRIRLGCMLPGDSASLVGDGLRRMAAVATYLYQDGSRYWYSIRPTITKAAEDLAQQLEREHDKLYQEVSDRLRKDLKSKGIFERIHLMPQGSHDVPDEPGAALVVLGPDLPHVKGATDSPAMEQCQEVFERRGTTPRIFRNSPVFLAADKTRLQELTRATARFLAWQKILENEEEYSLDARMKRQAETQRQQADLTVSSQLPEAYHWLIVPEQVDPAQQLNWEAIKLGGNDGLAIRAGKKLLRDEKVVDKLAPTALKMQLDQILWKNKPHLTVKQLIEYFGSYTYLQRLTSMSVLTDAISEGVAQLSWQLDGFAYADAWDEGEKRYRGLRTGERVLISDHDPGLIVKAENAQRQRDQEADESASANAASGESSDSEKIDGAGVESGGEASEGPVPGPAKKEFRRYHGAVELDALRVGRDAGRIADEVVTHLLSLKGARLRLTLEIEAEFDVSPTDQLIRIVTENGRTLKFNDQGFEEE